MKAIEHTVVGWMGRDTGIRVKQPTEVRTLPFDRPKTATSRKIRNALSTVGIDDPGAA